MTEERRIRVLAERANSIKKATATIISIESLLAKENLVNEETLELLEEVTYKILIRHAEITLEIIERTVKSYDRNVLKVGLFCCETCLGIFQALDPNKANINIDALEAVVNKEKLEEFRLAIIQKNKSTSLT